MSVADGNMTRNEPASFSLGGSIFKEILSKRALAGHIALTEKSRQIQALDPDGAHRNVTLPPERDGLAYLIVNWANAGENLVILNDAAGGVCTIGQNTFGIVICQGTTWYSATFAVTTVAVA